jgi:hypothetical protein
MRMRGCPTTKRPFHPGVTVVWRVFQGPWTGSTGQGEAKRGEVLCSGRLHKGHEGLLPGTGSYVPTVSSCGTEAMFLWH